MTQLGMSMAGKADTKKVADLVRAFAVQKKGLSALHADDPMIRIGITRAGLPAKSFDLIANEMAVSKEWVFGALGVPRATAMRQISRNGTLSQEATERALFVAGLVKAVESMSPETQAGGFNAAHWVAAWLDQPQPALGGKTPEAFLDTADGRAIVGRLLGQMESGAYT